MQQPGSLHESDGNDPRGFHAVGYLPHGISVQIFSGQVFGVSLFRLLASPYITLAACRLLGVQGVQCAAAVLINAAPVVNTATIYCQKYHGDMGFTNACVFVSAMLSFVTFWLIRF